MTTSSSRRPPGFWPQLIEDALRSLRGTSAYEDIYKWAENSGRLTEEELSASRYEGRPFFHHTIRATMSNMVKAGKVEQVGRGRYRLR